MARYYFHLHDQAGITLDQEGVELSQVSQAHVVALKAARAIISADGQTGHIDLRSRIEVLDEDGKNVLTLPFTGAVIVNR